MGELLRKFDKWLFALLLLVIAWLSYGLFINQLGFYGDDWYIIWHLKVLGPQSFFKFFVSERPWLAYLYAAITPLIGTSTISWHIWGIVVRWLTALCSWWLLCLIWRDKKYLAMMVALLFLVYPGFRDQYVSVVYSIIMIALLFEFLSFILMIYYLRVEKPLMKYFMLFMSLLCQIFNLFPLEYFFGLEILRLMIIWVVQKEKEKTLKIQISSTLKIFSPYAMISGLFLYWRVFIFKFPTKYQPIFSDTDTSQFVVTLFNVGKAILDDFFEVTLFSWIQAFEPLRDLYNASSSTIISLLIGGLSFTLLIVFFRQYYYQSQIQGEITDIKKDDIEWSKTVLSIGLLSVLFMGIPFWFVGWQVNLTTGENRFTLPFMLSVCLAVLGIIVILVRRKVQQVILVGLLVGLSTAQHFRDSNSYRLIHAQETTLLQQFLWRANDLKPGTIILINDSPTNFSSDTVLMSMINWAYDKNPSQNIKIGLFYLNDKRIGRQIPALDKGLDTGYGIRVMRFRGSTSNSLVAYYQNPGCLKIIDPENNYYSAILPSIVQKASFLSNLSQIDVDSYGNDLPPEQFKYRPLEDWCYYYEKAELMNQRQQWEEVVKLGKEAEKKGYKPAFNYEYFPFIRGYIMTGQWDDALKLSVKIRRSYPLLKSNLCTLWEKATQESALLDSTSVYLTAKNLLDCE